MEAEAIISWLQSSKRKLELEADKTEEEKKEEKPAEAEAGSDEDDYSSEDDMSDFDQVCPEIDAAFLEKFITDVSGRSVEIGVYLSCL